MTFWAVAALDAVLVAMNGWWTGAEMRNALELTDPKLLVMDEKRRARLDGDPGVPLLLTEHDFAGLFDDPARHAPRRADRRGRPVHPDLHQRHHRSAQGRGALAPVGDLVPDGAVVHRRARHGDGGRAVRGRSRRRRPDAPDAPPPTVRLAPYPLFHVSGMSMAVSTVMSGSPTVWPLGRFDPADVLRLTRDEGISVWGGGTTHVVRLLQHPDIETIEPGSNQRASASAAPPRRPTCSARSRSASRTSRARCRPATAPPRPASSAGRRAGCSRPRPTAWARSCPPRRPASPTTTAPSSRPATRATSRPAAGCRCSATGTTTTPTPRPCAPAAGSAPATSVASRTASSSSRRASATSSSAAARTSTRSRSSTASTSTTRCSRPRSTASTIPPTGRW